MQFALNYSAAAGRLFNDGVLLLDAFKCPDFPHMIAAARMHLPVVVHFPLEIGTGIAHDLDGVAEIAADTETHLINCHLVCRRRHHAGYVGYAASESEQAEFVELALQDLRPIVERFGKERVAVENLIYNGRPGRVEGGSVADDWLLPGVQAAVIRAVIERADVGLLLDVSHARIAAHYAGWDAKAYIASLPVERLRELHLTGLGMHEGVLTDHLPLTDADWAFTQWALDEVKASRWGRPEVVASEYGGEGPPFAWRTDERVIAEQTPRLYEMAQEACG